MDDARAEPIFMAVAESMGSLGCGPKPRRMYRLAWCHCVVKEAVL